MIATFKYVHSYHNFSVHSNAQNYIYFLITIRILENFIWQWYRLSNAKLFVVRKSCV